VEADENPEGWTRAEWARFFLDHDEPAAAARQLGAGDDLAVDEAAFPDLARELHRQGLAALYEDGWAYVYTIEDALAVVAELERDAGAGGDRRPPARSPAQLEPRRPAIRAANAPSSGLRARTSRQAG
jgi:hypothetical protein